MRPTELKRGSTMKLEGGRGTMVRVIYGNVWLTQDTDRNDYLMRSCERTVLNGSGTALIYAFEDSAVHFVAPESAQLPCNVELRLRGVVHAAY